MYQFLGLLSFPFLWIVIQYRAFRGKESPLFVLERWGKSSLPRPSGKILWIHGASVGEAMATLGIIQRIAEMYPHLSILLTTGTKASAQILRKRFKKNTKIFHQMIPLDSLQPVRRFVEFWKPFAGLFVESDFWPNLLTLPAQKGIPIAVLNAQISEKSMRRWRWGKPLLSFCFRSVQTFLTVSVKQAERLQSLGAHTIKITGSLKWTTLPLSVNEKVLTDYQKWIGNRPCWLAASTHPEETDLLLIAHKKLQQQFPGLLLCLAPRRIVPLSALLPSLERNNFSIQCKSAFSLSSKLPDILYIDEMDTLGLFYRLCPLTCVGGSFDPKIGGHNPIEPARLGSVVIHGPWMTKQQDIIDLFHTHQAALCVTTAHDLAEKITELLKNPSLRKQLMTRAQLLIHAQETHVLTKTLQTLSPLLESTR